MSSTGYISGVTSSPTTIAREEQRQENIQSGSNAKPSGPEEGIVVEIDPKLMRVRVARRDGTIVANNQFVRLDYTKEEFAQSFGDVKLGDVMLVTSTGIGGQPSGRIVARNGEDPENAIRPDNKVKLGVGPFLFPPGIGIG